MCQKKHVDENLVYSQELPTNPRTSVLEIVEPCCGNRHFS